MNLVDLIERFPDNESCRQELIAIRWPDGVRCPRCDCDRVSELRSRRQWTCLGCRYRFSAISGTIFENTKIGLRTWFMGIFIVLNAKKSISSHQLGRELGITQECCWHMIHRIREMMREDDRGLFSGTVQADDYYSGGAPRPYAKKAAPLSPTRQRTRGRATKKTPVVGAIEEKSGRVRTKKVANMTSESVNNTLGKWIDLAKTELHTDEFRGYKAIGKRCAEHFVVAHKREYVTDAGIHINAVENAWSLFARAIMGSFHHVSPKHLDRYLDEFDSRFNARKASLKTYFGRVLHQGRNRSLPMKELTGKAGSGTV